MFFQKNARRPREQNIKYCGFIKDTELTSLKKKIQNTTGFVNKDTMTDILQKRNMK